MIKILVLGDSHSNIFNYCNKKQTDIFFEVIEVPGATAQGSVNPNNNTNSLNIFKEKLNNIKQNEFQYIIINLGEVDCGYLIWYRKNKYNITIDEQLKITTNNLFDFINSQLLSYFEPYQIILNGSVLPTIKNNTDKKYLKGARSEVNASQINRTLLTLKYNSILKNHSFVNGYNYMDITNYILDTKTNVVNNLFLNKNKYDHHLDNDTTYNFWLTELYKIIK
jgi:hypothetical protein